MSSSELESSSRISFEERLAAAKSKKAEAAKLEQQEKERLAVEETRRKNEADAAERARVEAVKQSPQWQELLRLSKNADLISAIKAWWERGLKMKTPFSETFSTILYPESMPPKIILSLFLGIYTDGSYNSLESILPIQYYQHREYQRFDLNLTEEGNIEVHHHSDSYSRLMFSGSPNEFLDYMAELVA